MIDHALRDQLKDVHAYALTIYQRDDLYALDLDGFARNIAWAADRGVRVFCGGWRDWRKRRVGSDRARGVGRVCPSDGGRAGAGGADLARQLG